VLSATTNRKAIVSRWASISWRAWRPIPRFKNPSHPRYQRNPRLRNQSLCLIKFPSALSVKSAVEESVSVTSASSCKNEFVSSVSIRVIRV
jgi:hypothetical protein